MKRLALFFAVVGLAACSSVTEPLGMEDPFAVPQPFKGMERNDDMIGEAIRVPALIVAVPEGLTEDRAVSLRDRVVELAQASDIPALSEASVRAWSMSGQAAKIQSSAKPASKAKKRRKPDGSGQGVIVWRLADPDGAERAKFSVTFKTMNDMLGDADLRLAAQETVKALDAALLRPRTQVAEAVTSAQRPTAWIGAIRGAPGDGNQALAQALGGVLPMKGVAVEATQAKAQWRIEGRIKVTAGPSGQDVVTLTWRVLDAKGAEAGTISQENAVPRGRLSKPWREIAGFAAEAAAEGIAQLIQQVTAASQG
jgi:uncharacterized lipoprotein YmbA